MWNNLLKKLHRLFFKEYNNNYSVDDKYNVRKHEKENELDVLLEKINRKGINSLTAKERKRLNELSK
jgi:hypothetical protein